MAEKTPEQILDELAGRSSRGEGWREHLAHIETAARTAPSAAWAEFAIDTLARDVAYLEAERERRGAAPPAARAEPEWHHLVDEDAGGQRWHLAGEPVHAGTGLILKVGASELHVCFESRDGEPVLYVETGASIEDEDGRVHSPPRLACRVEGRRWSQLWLRWPPARRW